MKLLSGSCHRAIVVMIGGSSSQGTGLVLLRLRRDASRPRDGHRATGRGAGHHPGAWDAAAHREDPRSVGDITGVTDTNPGPGPSTTPPS